MIKYIGSKRTLIPAITGVVEAIPNAHSIVDFFSGTSRVGHAFKKKGYQVFSNDLLTYAHTLATCYVQADLEQHLDAAESLINEFNTIKGSAGYFTETFCIQSRYFQPQNGERVDAIREAIAAKCLDPELEAICITSLMEAADRVDSTTGVQMAYLKKWAARASNSIKLRVPNLAPRSPHGKSQAHQLEARKAASQLSADVAYIDPPYNQHTYIGNYHIWETLALWDKPEHYGIACKRIDCKERKSDFNSKRKANDAFREFISLVNCDHLVISFNNEGFIDRNEMEQTLSAHGEVVVIENDYKRYVGAQIGIHNLRGERVGKISHLNNKEFIYVCSRNGADWLKNVATPASEEATLFP